MKVRVRPSLQLSVAALALACVLAAQTASVLALALLPPRGAAPVTPAAMAAALRGDAANPSLRRSVRSNPPFPDHRPTGHDRLIVRVLDPLLAGSRLTDLRVRSLSRAVWIETEGAPPSSPDPFRRSLATGGLAQAPFPSFTAAARRRDGLWVVVRPATPLLSSDRAGELLAFLFSAVLLAPLTWWSARSLTRPLKDLAEASKALGHDLSRAPLAVNGPTEVRTAALAFNDMQARLRVLLDERSKVMGAIAHDLRTPLTGLRLRIETAPPEPRARMASDIARMDALIADLLLFARDGRTDVTRGLVDLEAIARSCAAEAKASGANIDMAGSGPIVVHGDALALRRVVENLLNNALTYAGAGRLSWGSAAGGAAWLRVDDEGPGIPQDAMERVFDPFVRLEPSRSRSTGGVGLGLAIARDIARAHGGDVRLLHREPRGLTAWLSLPSVEQSASIALDRS